MRLRRAAWGAMLWIGATATVGATPVSPSGNVVDMAGVLEVDTMLELDSTLANYTAGTGFTVSVITVQDLADDVLQDYARVSLQAYVAASSDAESRVALLIWSSAQQLAIAVSPAFGRELSPTEVAQVLRDQILPQVTTDAVGTGMLHGVYGLMMAAGAPADEAANPQELVMVARWGAGAGVSTPTAAPEGSDAPPIPRPDAGAGLDALMRELRSNPGAAIGAGWERARVQWTVLRGRVGELAAELRGSAGDPGNTTAFAMAGLILLAFLFGAWRITGSLAAPAIVSGLAAAALCWGLTGFIELTVLLALSGFAAWIGLRVLRLLLTRNDEPRLQADGYAPGTAMSAANVPVMRPAAMPASSPDLAQTPVKRAGTTRAPAPDLLASIKRAHSSGIATPALDHLMAQKGKPKVAQRQKQRQYWLLAIAICFFLLFPLALLLMVAWAVTELNHLKPPHQKLSDFLRQLWSELQRVGAHRRPHA